MRGFLVIPDPDDPVNKVHATHVPATVRGSATVCTECGEAWPCTAWVKADADNYDRMDTDEGFLAIIPIDTDH